MASFSNQEFYDIVFLSSKGSFSNFAYDIKWILANQLTSIPYNLYSIIGFLIISGGIEVN